MLTLTEAAGAHLADVLAEKDCPDDTAVRLVCSDFYNPFNTMKALLGLRRDSVSAKRLLFQVIGQIGLVMTIPKMLRWAWQLKRGPIEAWDGLQLARIPMIDAGTRKQIDWAIKRPPTPNLPQRVETASTTMGTRPPLQPAPAVEVAG